jgi:uncharacterized phosphosugar-binding protein
MDVITAYLEGIRTIIETALQTQRDAMEKAAQMIASAVERKRSIFAFGANHAGILAQELYYRTGGLALIHYIRAPGLALDVEPPTLTTDMERLDGYGNAIIASQPIGEGDVLILHSVSGRNAVSIDAAFQAKKQGAATICLTNMKTSAALPSRHKSGKKLYELCDLAIDNCGSYGDAEIALDKFPQKVAPSSTVVGAAILNAVVARVIAILAEKGTPPVFISANIPGGDEHNKRIMEEYAAQIHYR